jgi:hypothetical protein
MLPGAHVVIFLIAFIENWPCVDEGVVDEGVVALAVDLAVDVMTCDEVGEDELDEAALDEAGEEVKTAPIRPGSGGIGGGVWPTCRSAC